ncbi:hypothetical protein SDC9_80885 [bioreactor metagenome]|uniref:Uncharacterized protein n=1 Tax=bioreactor metagenome TaxID=1076179 RepID=A0A644Z6F4_9ZZZZ
MTEFESYTEEKGIQKIWLVLLLILPNILI